MYVVAIKHNVQLSGYSDCCYSHWVGCCVTIYNF